MTLKQQLQARLVAGFMTMWLCYHDTGQDMNAIRWRCGRESFKALKMQVVDGDDPLVVKLRHTFDHLLDLTENAEPWHLDAIAFSKQGGAA